ncbi:MAG: DUF448 domain-containing protein [Desulfovermiculus sp.]
MNRDHPEYMRPKSSNRQGKAAQHIPQRMCCICRSRLLKYHLHRYVCQRDGRGQPALYFDPKQSLPGRGFYVCSDPGCQSALPRHRGWQKKCRGES